MATDADPAMLLSQLSQSEDLDKLLTVEELSNNAYENDVIRDIPRDRREYITTSSIIVSTKKKLYHLGYYKGDRESSELTDQFRSAVRNFQRDANIVIDGWVGPETWEKLQQLFNFEPDNNLNASRFAGVTEGLLHRSAQLRLFTLGLLETAPSERVVELSEAIKEFVAVCVDLQLLAQNFTTAFDEELLLQLFDQDGLTARLAQPKDAAFLEALPTAARNRAKRFLVCIAKIELWLLGYPVEPDGNGAFGGNASGDRGMSLKKQPKDFFWSLKSFCEDLEEQQRVEIRPRRFFRQFPEVFAQFNLLQAEARIETSLEEKVNTVYETIDQHSLEARTAWDAIRELGGRIWDGIKRAWAWLKRTAGKLIKTVVNAVTNAVRLAWSFAREGIGLVRAAIKSFPKAVNFVIKRDVDGSDVSKIVLNHDKDFDWRVFVPSSVVQGTEIHPVLTILKTRVAQFAFSCRILALLVSALLKVIKYAPAGYFALVLAMLKIRPQLQAFMDYYLANRDLLLADEP